MARMTSEEFVNNRGKEVIVKGCLVADDPRNMYKGYYGTMTGIVGNKECDITEAAFVAGHKKGECWKLLQRGDLQKSNVKRIDMIYDHKMDAFGMKITDNAGRKSYISTLTCERTEDFMMLGYFIFKKEGIMLVVGMVGAHQPILVTDVYEGDGHEESALKAHIVSMMGSLVCEEIDF